MRTPSRSRAAGWAGLAAAALIVSGFSVSAEAAGAPTGAVAAPVLQASTTTTAVSTAPSYATVVPTFWFPFRGPVKVGCVVNNCGTAMNGGHGYWAFDFSGPEGTPVHAALSGTAHIGGRANCVERTATSNEKRGNWVWIDHGKGRTTQYRHLSTITIKEGQHVTRLTQVGTMGHTSVAPCTINYTHFEYHIDAKPGKAFGTRANPGPMFGCVSEVRNSYPQAVSGGNTNWNALDSSPKNRVTISIDYSRC